MNQDPGTLEYTADRQAKLYQCLNDLDCRARPRVDAVRRSIRPDTRSGPTGAQSDLSELGACENPILKGRWHQNPRSDSTPLLEGSATHEDSGNSPEQIRADRVLTFAVVGFGRSFEFLAAFVHDAQPDLTQVEKSGACILAKMPERTRCIGGTVVEQRERLV